MGDAQALYGVKMFQCRRLFVDCHGNAALGVLVVMVTAQLSWERDVCACVRVGGWVAIRYTGGHPEHYLTSQTSRNMETWRALMNKFTHAHAHTLCTYTHTHTHTCRWCVDERLGKQPLCLYHNYEEERHLV